METLLLFILAPIVNVAIGHEYQNEKHDNDGYAAASELHQESDYNNGGILFNVQDGSAHSNVNQVTVPVPVAVPVPFTVFRAVPVPVPQPYAVPVHQPLAVEVPRSLVGNSNGPLLGSLYGSGLGVMNFAHRTGQNQAFNLGQGALPMSYSSGSVGNDLELVFFSGYPNPGSNAIGHAQNFVLQNQGFQHAGGHVSCPAGYSTGPSNLGQMSSGHSQTTTSPKRGMPGPRRGHR
ncbi:uncharacterized protein [Periplaneta americana]|uniref:uncharacterized protein n=1 Tax=Periplaneta americana TaxID=6978 RepID=UPI0037E7E536